MLQLVGKELDTESKVKSELFSSDSPLSFSFYEGAILTHSAIRLLSKLALSSSAMNNQAIFRSLRCATYLSLRFLLLKLGKTWGKSSTRRLRSKNKL